MKVIQFLAILWFLANPSVASAIEIENVVLPDSITAVKSGKSLILNGAGIRTKFFFDIYVCGLYLENKTRNPEDIILSKGEKQIIMHFLYDEVSKEKLASGWTDGFDANHTSKQMASLNERLIKFNNMFETVKRGNTIRFDFFSDGTLDVIINNKVKGNIQGHDFQQALLRIWLGKEPVTDELKSALLGLNGD